MLERPSPSGGEAAEFIEWQSEIAAFAAIDKLAPAPADAVLFVGSSSIRLWHTLAADFPELPTINRGFGGSEIADSLYFAEQLIGAYRPRAIVMYAGGNDLANGKSPAQVRDAFGAFVAQARHWAGQVPFAYLSIKPNLSRRRQLPRIRQANALLRACAEERGVDYLDIHAPMLGADGEADPRWFDDDGLHLNAEGYALWRGVVRDWLARRGLL
ncbi:GDSL-type esterase/lipase family protein [Frateuria soli]|uniref:GDSL-type esterase/lipase family protein n=1 Tax=Frateuria soli TaxID=1542730 RepID=UPI001E527F8D|nr:GDSL-type esterase/lipase family protein [Frateuria soli]UGB38064.1 GDSL-type esterase/lipase family protein [Frateuria soli]